MQTLVLALSMVALAQEPVGAADDVRLDGLSAEHTVLARTALDDRASSEARAEAAAALSAERDADLLWILRAAVRDRDPRIQQAIIEGVAPMQDPESVSLLAWVVADPETDKAQREAALTALSSDPSDAAGAALYTLASDRQVPSGLRTRARDALTANHAALIAEHGDPRPVTDVLGGMAFAGAWGVTGGVALASIGSWGTFDGGEAIGAVGGSAIGLGTSTYALTRVPISTGQGVAQASGVAWGLTVAQWTTHAAYGRPRWTHWDRPDAQALWETRRTVGAGFRLAGVGIGAALGTRWMLDQPDPWDVMEVNLATYLGSAVALAGTGLVVWTPQDWSVRWDPQQERAFYDRRWQEGRILDASNILGGAVGLGVGLALQDSWDLEFHDAVFASTLGLEAAWLGWWVPTAFNIDASDMKGTVRLPWNATIAGGLALAEFHAMPLQTSAVTLATGGSANAIGAGIPMLARAGETDIARVMAPVGLAGTAAGVLAAPHLDPGLGEWSASGLSAGLGALNLGTFGNAALLDEQQSAGLALIGAGAGMSGALIAGRWLDPRADDMLTLTTAAGWGAFYGGLAPVALGNRLDDAYRGAVIAGGSDLFVGGVAVALAAGLEPRHTVVPQLVGLSGATAGALITGLASPNEEDVAAGALIGATVGLGGGAVLTALAGKSEPRTAALHLPLGLPGQWQPVLSPTVVDGESGVYLGVRGTGW